jgi:hypothetical protein
LFENNAFNNMRYRWPLVSALALLLFAWAGISAVWGGTTVAAVRFKAPEAFAGVAGSGSVEIHALVPDSQKASRVGRAYPSENGDVAIYLYPDVFDRDIDSVHFVMVDASVGLLWQLMPKSARRKAERSLQRLVAETQADMEKILSSEKFQTKYQKQFYEIVVDAARSAFDAPDTKVALDGAYNELLGAFGREFVAEYLSSLTKNSTLILDALYENFTKNILRFKKGGKLDFDPIREAIQQVMRDPLFKVSVQSRLEEFLLTDAAANLSATFGRRFVANTYSDPRLYDLLNALLADLAYSDDLRKFELKVTGSIREVVLEVLTRGNDAMDPVGAAILKNAFSGGRDRVVLMLTDEQLEKLSREYPRAFTPFVRL